MGSYRSEDEALIGLARQLTDAYGEARSREDQDYACDSVAAFLSEFRESAPSEALLAILDLPLTAETYPLVDEAQTTLAGRGPAVVRLLLEAVLGEVYDPDGPAPEHAAEALDMMDRRASVQGLIQVLCSRADDQLKGAAADSLVALGAFAEPGLAMALDDPDGSDWAQAALEQIRYEHQHSRGLEDYAAGEDFLDDASGLEPEDAVAEDDSLEFELGDVLDDADGEIEDDEVEDAGEEVSPEADGTAAQSVTESLRGPAAGSSAAPAPDQGLVDDAYEEFLRRFDREAGGEGSAP